MIWLRTFWIKEQTQLGLLGNYTVVISQWSCTEKSYFYHFYPKEGIVLNTDDPTSACYQLRAVHQPSSKISGWNFTLLVFIRLARRWGSTVGLGVAPSLGFTCHPSHSSRQHQPTVLSHMFWYYRLNTENEEIKQHTKSTRQVCWTNIFD